MKIDKLLQSQGFGSKKYCQQLILNHHLKINGEVVSDIKYQVPSQELDRFQFEIFNQIYLYREKVYLALNKPQGYECSHQPQYHHSVFDLLPEELLRRGVQSVGRLDQDTTGLLLFSDDGAFIQKMTHPRQHIGKRYLMNTADEIDEDQLRQLAAGVVLHNEKGQFQATDIEQISSHQFAMTIHQGVYHQVKRMVASVGNKVEYLQRIQMGELTLEQLALKQGEWCYLDIQQLQLLK